LIVDIGNYIVGPYNGSFNATLSIDFYNIPSPVLTAPPDAIVSLSKRLPKGKSTYFSLPDDNSSTSVFIPSNTSHVVLDVFASGNGQEEFWYSNIPNEFVDTFGAWNISFLGQGSFREIVVYIDGAPTGVVWPFEVVFTGGICPGFWRPIVGHRTFDLPMYRIDLTPFISNLRNGTHTFRFAVQGQPNTLQNWFVSGQLHFWYSNISSPIFALPNSLHNSISPKANITTTGKVAADNASFSINTLASRNDPLYTLEYENEQFYQLLENGTTVFQNLSQTTYFESPLVQGHYIFTLKSTETQDTDGAIIINASLSQIFHRQSTDIIDGSIVLEHAEVVSTGVLSIGKTANRSQGNTSVIVTYNSPRREYVRDVKAIGFDIVSDYGTDKSLPGLANVEFRIQDTK
jgi:Peptide N-acetyl-beta-D-glucosaminyl asparaginase amidase A